MIMSIGLIRARLGRVACYRSSSSSRGVAGELRRLTVTFAEVNRGFEGGASAEALLVNLKSLAAAASDII